MNESLALAIPGELSATSLRLRPSLSYEEWEAVGRCLGDISRGVMFWVGDWIRYGEGNYGERYSQALDLTNYDYQTLADAAWVAGKVEFSRRRENLSWSHHKEVAALPPVEQEEWLDRAAQENLTRNDLRNEIRRAKVQAKLKSATPELKATDKFSVIYADPPWRYDFAETDSRQIENQYPTMDIEEICALPVADVAAVDSVLFLWATSPKLREGLTVVEAWGFDYKTCMVWYKDKIGMGYYARQQHELLLIAKRGEFPVPAPEDRPPSVIQAPRTKHSAKPTEFYQILERMYPDAPKIELFCRSPREGWAVWGNEVLAA